MTAFTPKSDFLPAAKEENDHGFTRMNTDFDFCLRQRKNDHGFARIYTDFFSAHSKILKSCAAA
jgi:hypothetical protein